MYIVAAVCAQECAKKKKDYEDAAEAMEKKKAEKIMLAEHLRCEMRIYIVYI
jgi:hypothetical protein